MNRHTLAPAAMLALAVLCSCACELAVAQTWYDAIGYTELKSRLGDNIPDGGGSISMVEAPIGSASYPNTASTEFNGTFDASSTPVQFFDGSGVSGGGISNHATGVAMYFFGDLTSIADGANQVTHYEAGNWMSNKLKSGTSQPDAQPFRVQNHSWIGGSGTPGPNAQDQSVLRRFDWTIETGEMTAVVGANNATTMAAHPNLLVHSYNAIVAGRSDGFHSRGVTNSVYGAGRYRPDIVAPLTATSHTSPVVGSAASVLHEAVAGTDAAKSETMKAMLLAGATKQEFASFQDPLNGGAVNPWNRTSTRPLDDVLGAGELNVYNSYLIQLGGQHAGSQAIPSTMAGSFGWDYQNHKANASVGDIYYNFEIPAGSTAEEMSIILAWNAKITDTSPGASFTPVESLQNLDLQFYDSSGSFMGSLLDQSISTEHNVEHIYLTDLNPGTYTLKVNGAASWDYGLAWRMATKFDQISADFDEDGDVDGRDFLTWQRNLGTLLGASHGDGDADGDGDVDSEDLLAVRNQIMPLGPPSGPSLALGGVAAIPEPSALLLAAGALLAGAGWQRRVMRRG